MHRRAAMAVLSALVFAVVAVVVLLPRIPQSAIDSAYGGLADDRVLLAMPNALNVLSNALFVMVGICGLWFVARRRDAFRERAEAVPYAVFFFGVTVTGFGSAYFHWQPNDARLVWDRLPMTVAFMSFCAAMVAERIGVKAGLRLLVPLVAMGIARVLYWHYTESRGAGDLRPYAVVQFGPLVLVPALMMLFPPRYTRSGDVLVVLGWYVLAKIFERLDAAIFALCHIVSGHTLKHLAAALGACWMLRMLRLRQPIAR